MTEITLTQGRVALIDDEDSDRVSQYSWNAVRNHKTWYAKAWIKRDGKPVREYLHRFIANAMAGEEIDHRNNDGLDCRKENLRRCTHSQNLANQRQRRGKLSRFRGVTPIVSNATKPWRAQMRVGGRQTNLGHFETEEMAAAAYDLAATKEFGEFAKLNFPVSA